MSGKSKVKKTILRIVNKKAHFKYELLDRYEAGMLLNGAEVKSLRAGQMDLSESFIRIKNGEAWLYNALIAVYPQATYAGSLDPKRTRKLLLHQQEILKISHQVDQKNLTIVPTVCYNKHGVFKLEIALAKGKRDYEKRETIKKREWKQDIG
jgi:SsrA-binding protein